MKRIGILSDTHGTFDDVLREFFDDVDEIWHAGDIGTPELADRIAAFKPLRACTATATTDSCTASIRRSRRSAARGWRC